MHFPSFLTIFKNLKRQNSSPKSNAFLTQKNASIFPVGEREKKAKVRAFDMASCGQGTKINYRQVECQV
jgi:hypothetical protein